VLVEHPGDVGIERRDLALQCTQLREQFTDDQSPVDADRVGGADPA
jgi:hypothetical protein